MVEKEEKWLVVVTSEIYGDETYVEEITTNEEGIKKYLQSVQKREYKNYRNKVEKYSGDVVSYDDGSYSCHLYGEEDTEGFVVQVWAFPYSGIKKKVRKAA